MRSGLTKRSSATAGGNEHGLQWSCFHSLVQSIRMASGSLHRRVERSRLRGGLRRTEARPDPKMKHHKKVRERQTGTAAPPLSHGHSLCRQVLEKALAIGSGAI